MLVDDVRFGDIVNKRFAGWYLVYHDSQAQGRKQITKPASCHLPDVATSYIGLGLIDSRFIHSTLDCKEYT